MLSRIVDDDLVPRYVLLRNHAIFLVVYVRSIAEISAILLEILQGADNRINTWPWNVVIFSMIPVFLWGAALRWACTSNWACWCCGKQNLLQIARSLRWNQLEASRHFHRRHHSANFPLELWNRWAVMDAKQAVQAAGNAMQAALASKHEIRSIFPNFYRDVSLGEESFTYES